MYRSLWWPPTRGVKVRAWELIGWLPNSPQLSPRTVEHSALFKDDPVLW